LGSMVQIHFGLSGFECFEHETWKTSEVNDLSTHVMMDEWPRFSLEVRVSGVPNVKPEKSPKGKSPKWNICCHVSPLMDRLDLLWDFESLSLWDFWMWNIKISPSKIPEVNDLLLHVVTDERSRFSSKIWASGVQEFINVMLGKLLKENHWSNVSGSRDFGSSSLRRLWVFAKSVLWTWY
jgi:hypothetical protein